MAVILELKPKSKKEYIKDIKNIDCADLHRLLCDTYQRTYEKKPNSDLVEMPVEGMLIKSRIYQGFLVDFNVEVRCENTGDVIAAAGYIFLSNLMKNNEDIAPTSYKPPGCLNFMVDEESPMAKKLKQTLLDLQSHL